MMLALRISDLREKEEGTFSLPSGDSAACALMCFLYAHCMHVYVIYLILPLVCMGRIYYHCHWIGDTILGSIIGTIWGIIGVANFDLMVPLMQKIAGDDYFLTLD
jgi:membrane-associated phospholipid phosphatase